MTVMGLLSGVAEDAAFIAFILLSLCSHKRLAFCKHATKMYRKPQFIIIISLWTITPYHTLNFITVFFFFLNSFLVRNLVQTFDLADMMPSIQL